MLVLAVLCVSAALILGAVWGLYGPLNRVVSGFIVAMAGGALILAVVLELVEPSIARSGLTLSVLSVGAGAIVFSSVDYLIDEHWQDGSGLGLLAAVTLDGIPENVALGVAIIGSGSAEMVVLAGSIVLSNLPEAAGGAKAMAEQGDRSKMAVLGIWCATAGLLAAAAVLGHVGLSGAPDKILDALRCFAGGAVVASLATEVFPTAFREDHHLAGIATTIGLIAAAGLHHLGA
ncbi:hypothetical protein PB2503_05502 [Parvularcula bermudensis HTCC2503]|uniref:Zinc transporter n=1 Tax=Parvularcula bermudensis (strain ATCC BAA-594 / HTCC2503 / KCTC 12087) TaxID=314260 RepID=E0TGD0_PARBH|nr:hypothetical protein [Parvularcula bermudensis]ADM09173.1 hypothetical protein PB2503_05502 [Parvularcula bermudensis HTCC2503]